MKKAVSPGRGRPRGFDTDQVLTTAMTVFWRHGYEGASLTALQEATGLNAPSIYHAFGSKEGLYRACLDQFLARIGSGITRPLNRDRADREGLLEALRTAAVEFTVPGRPGGCMISTAALTLSPQGEGVATELAGRREQARQLFADYFHRAREQGHLSAEVDPNALARYIGSIIQGMSVQAMDGASRSELEDVIALAMRVWPDD
ncbi:TetR family transcriptional regulator [Stackebrandtia endophytica]|uniref:TetR family transcriptional regulator n=1 Tax=Stackebrandtia endophytica TaxID=1496996 RepID=A0A543AUZ8_9ACTN|nr:TetR/AcrR family transcriptional regulator [Stackebrandtia endophytica]TQL76400.1 TetR family transcriptional regulator [Stackebrandtia endophytica]